MTTISNYTTHMTLEYIKIQNTLESKVFPLLLKDIISDFYLTLLQLVLCRVAAVKRLPVHQP